MRCQRKERMVAQSIRRILREAWEPTVLQSHIQSQGHVSILITHSLQDLLL